MLSRIISFISAWVKPSLGGGGSHAVRYLSYGLWLVLLAGILVCRYNVVAGEWYALHFYPVVSAVLSSLTGWIPFSLEEMLVVGGAVGMTIYPIIMWRKKKWRQILRAEVEFLLWIYVWFYWGWGMNYFRQTFFHRAGVKPLAYDEQQFCEFLSSYTDSLNGAYYMVSLLDKETVHKEVLQIFSRIPTHYGLQLPSKVVSPKRVMFSALYSSVGVLGYMGPFFNEMQLNARLLTVQYPFTYAHELSHLLGVSNEAEANFWAYYTCTSSRNPYIRYAGYFGLLPYVAGNAQRLLSEERYSIWIKSIRPEVIKEFQAERKFWHAQYSPMIGAIQDWAYDHFLKANQIPAGKKNYAEVIQMIMAFDANTE